MKNYFLSAQFSVLLIILFSVFSAAQVKQKLLEREMDFDEAGNEETLNRELWQAIKGTSYKTALLHIERAKRNARPSLNSVVLPNGWQIAPAGEQTEVGRLPMEAVAFGNQIVVLNTGYYSNAPQEVSVVDPNSHRVVKILRLPGLFPSAAIGTDNNLYISGGISQKVFRFNTNFEAGREYSVNGFVAGLAPVDADHIAVVYLVTATGAEEFRKGDFRQGKLALLNTKSGVVERETIVGYFPQTVRFLNNKFYVAVSGENKLQIFDRELKSVGTLQLGKNPQNSCVGNSGTRLYIVNQNSDDLSVIDTQRDRLISTLSVAWKGSRFGSAPTSCAIGNNRLYVTQANTNDVAVFDARTNSPLGLVPTGFYPTKVLFANNQLIIVNAKGARARRPNVDGPQAIAELGGAQYVLTLLQGSVAFIPQAEMQTKLAAWTKQIESGTPIFDSREGLKLPIKHVFYIVRENRTYDQVLGDLPRGDGDRFLTLFGRDITPSAHQMADNFVTLDNYYADGEISVLGHSFTTSGYASPFLEWLGNNAYSGRFPGYPFGMVPATTSPAYLWDALDDKKISYRIYGENYFLYTRAYRILVETFGVDNDITRKFYAQVMNYAARVDRGNIFYRFAKPFYGQMDTPESAEQLLANPDFARLFSNFLCGDESLIVPLKDNGELRRRFAEYLTHYPSNYRSWDLTTSDLERAAAWKTDFERQVSSGSVAQFNYLWLPNDHTGGTDNKYLPPDQLVAQNDAALGVIIEIISKSPIWKDSLILVTEDDAQNGPDHVDATRTVALAVSPYVKRNFLAHDRFDQLSMLRTIEIVLGISPLNINDSLAAPMFSIFTDKPNFNLFKSPPPSANLSETDRRLYKIIEAAEKK